MLSEPETIQQKVSACFSSTEESEPLGVDGKAAKQELSAPVSARRPCRLINELTTAIDPTLSSQSFHISSTLHYFLREERKDTSRCPARPSLLLYKKKEAKNKCKDSTAKSVKEVLLPKFNPVLRASAINLDASAST